MKPTTAQTRAYQQIFDYLNRTLFQGSLPPCMLTFSRRNARSDGHFSPNAWHRGERDTPHGITLNPGMLRNEPRTVAATITRLMALHWQHTHGTPSRPGYNNLEYARKLESIGIMPSSTELPGGRATGQRMFYHIIPGGPFERAFDLMPADYYLPFRATDCSVSARRRAKFLYRCTGCGARAWGKPGLEMICSCGHPFVCEGTDPDNELPARVYRRLERRFAVEHRTIGGGRQADETVE